MSSYDIEFIYFFYLFNPILSKNVRKVILNIAYILNALIIKVNIRLFPFSPFWVPLSFILISVLVILVLQLNFNFSSK